MNTRTRQALVLSALAGGATVAGAYYLAAQQTGDPVEVVAAESQGDMIRAAARLREMGWSLEPAVRSLAEGTQAPEAAVADLVSQRWWRDRSDARQRYGRVGVLATAAERDAVQSAVQAAWCLPLTDPREGHPAHEAHADCLARAPLLAQEWCDAEGQVVGYGAGWAALPGDLDALADAAQTAGGTYVGGTDYDDVQAAYAQAVSDLGWLPCPDPEEEAP